MKYSNFVKGFAVLASLAIGGAASAATLYQQNWDGSGDAYASQNDTQGGNGNYATVYDNFTLGSAATITGLTFKGGYFNPTQQGNITGFTIGIYSSNAGQPGSALATFNIPGTGGESGCAIAAGRSLACDYSVAINFAAAGGTEYWLSVVSDVGYPPQWGFETGTGGDGVSYQDFFGARSPVNSDMAFALTGSGAVPEPATWAMMILGFGVVGAATRRKRNAMLFA